MRITVGRSLRFGTALLLAAAGRAAAQPQIDTGTPPTVPNWPIFAFGRATDVSYASYGQSFTVQTGAPTLLNEFQFWLRDNLITGSTPYHAYLFSWDPATRRTGDTYLFRSDPQSYSAGVTTPTAFSFVTGGVNLVGGQSYIAVLSSVEFPTAPSGLVPGMVVSTNWPNDGYAGGSSFVRFGPAGLGTLTSGPWTLAGGTGVDFAFRATFGTGAGPVPPTTVPEPSTLVLAASGVLGVALLRRRRPGRLPGIR